MTVGRCCLRDLQAREDRRPESALSMLLGGGVALIGIYYVVVMVLI